MAIGELIPWRWGGLRRLEEDQSFDSFRREMEALHRNLDRVFSNAWSGPSLLGESWITRDVTPRVDVTEDDKSFNVTVELPGMDEKDVDVELANGVLCIRGEKKTETEDKDQLFSERTYGRFERRIPVDDVEEDKVSAAFRNGVLTVTLPKSAQAQQKVKRIAVTNGK